MSIRDCVEKLVAAGQVTRKVADEALGLYERMKGKYSEEAAPAGAEAAAALSAARALNQAADDKIVQISNNVRAYRDIEARVVEHPLGRAAGLMATMTKDMWRGAKAMRDLPDESLVKRGPNVDYLHQGIRADLFNRFGAAMEAYRPGFLNNKETIDSVARMIREIKGVDTGDQVAKTAAAGWKEATKRGEELAKATGKVFGEKENYLLQHWEARRVGKVSEDEYVAAYRDRMSRGGMTLWDKDANAPASVARTDFILRRAYNDIKGEGGSQVPFSNEMRTFRFSDDAVGADAYLEMQRKFGVGDDFMAMLTGHLDHMAREVALSRVFGSNRDANFAAALKLVREKPEMPVVSGAEKYNPVRLFARPFQTEAMLRGTFKVVTGRAYQTQNEVVSSFLGGARDLIGASSLRNLPILIMPTDTVTTLMASNHIGMDGFRVLGELVDGATSKEAAAHLQINSHSMMDFLNGSVRKYDDEINYSGLSRKLSRGVIAATGARWWTESGRRAAQTSMMNQVAEMGKNSFDKLPDGFRRFLGAYGFTAEEWDRIRAIAPVEAGNGAKYYLNPDNLEPDLYQRLLNAVGEQGAYMFHQPDARTLAVAAGGHARGTAEGEVWRSFMQFKQFAVERMTTHLMRILTDGPIENRITRGLAFMTLSMAAGAVSLQAQQIVSGKDPLDMTKAGFWGNAFVKGGGGGIYSDILAAGLRGERGVSEVSAELAGPLAGLAGDVIKLGTSPIRAQFDETGSQTKQSSIGQAIGVARRTTPNTWYTKLAIDRLWWDQLQTLADPDYRGSFRRAEQAAAKKGQGLWWEPGETAPQRAPNPGTALGNR